MWHVFSRPQANYDHGLDDDDDDDAPPRPLSVFEPEFTAYYIVYFLDNERGLEVAAFLRTLLQTRKPLYETPEVQRAVRVWRAKRDDDYAAFFRELRGAPYVMQCALYKHVAAFRGRALAVMNRAYRERVPLEWLRVQLCYETEADAALGCLHYGLLVERADGGDVGSEVLDLTAEIKGNEAEAVSRAAAEAATGGCVYFRQRPFGESASAPPERRLDGWIEVRVEMTWHVRVASLNNEG